MRPLFVILFQTFYKKIIASEKNRRIALRPPDIQIPDFNMIIRRLNPFLRLILHIVNRGFGTLATSVCNHFAKIVQQIIASEKSTHRIATSVCNPIAKIVQKNHSIRKKSTHRIATSVLYSFCKDCTKKS